MNEITIKENNKAVLIGVRQNPTADTEILLDELEDELAIVGWAHEEDCLVKEVLRDGHNDFLCACVH